MSKQELRIQLRWKLRMSEDKPFPGGYPVSFAINNGTPVSVNAGPALTPGQTATFTFTGTNAWTPSSEGIYSITCTASAPGDGNTGNNSVTTGGIYIFPAAATFFTGFNDSTQFFNGTTSNLIVPAGWLTINNDGGGTSGPWFVHNPAVFPPFEGRTFNSRKLQRRKLDHRWLN
jgi:hypothetical protein